MAKMISRRFRLRFLFIINYKHIHVLQTHVDAPDKFLRTPLHIAAMNNKVEVVKLLMNRYY